MAAEFITGVRTKDKDVAIDYRFLAHTPESDKTLTIEGDFADAKVVGDKLALKADITYVDEQIQASTNNTENITSAINEFKKTVDEELEKKADITYVDENTSLLTDTSDHEGKILRVSDGVASWQEASSALDATDDDNGKILTVVKGTPTWISPADALAIITPEVDDGDGDGEEGDDEQITIGEILIKDNGTTKWESIANAIAASATEAGQFLSVDVTDTGEKIAYWRTVIDADKVEF